MAFPIDYESITVGASAVEFTPLKMNRADFCVVTVEDGAIRVRADGLAPTSTEGHQVNVAEQFIIRGRTVMSNMKMIKQGASDGKIRVTYFAGDPMPGPDLDFKTNSAINAVDGSIVGIGAKADAAVTPSGLTGSMIALLKGLFGLLYNTSNSMGLADLLGDVYDSVNHTLKVNAVSVTISNIYKDIYTVNGDETLSVGTTAVGLASIPALAARALVHVREADVRVRILGAGSPPTSTTGALWRRGSYYRIEADDLANFRAILDDGAYKNATLDVTYQALKA